MSLVYKAYSVNSVLSPRLDDAKISTLSKVTSVSQFKKCSFTGPFLVLCSEISVENLPKLVLNFHPFATISKERNIFKTIIL